MLRRQRPLRSEHHPVVRSAAPKILASGPRKGACPKKAHRSAPKSVAIGALVGALWDDHPLTLDPKTRSMPNEASGQLASLARRGVKGSRPLVGDFKGQRPLRSEHHPRHAPSSRRRSSKPTALPRGTIDLPSSTASRRSAARPQEAVSSAGGRAVSHRCPPGRCSRRGLEPCWSAKRATRAAAHRLRRARPRARGAPRG